MCTHDQNNTATDLWRLVDGPEGASQFFYRAQAIVYAAKEAMASTYANRDDLPPQLYHFVSVMEAAYNELDDGLTRLEEQLT